MTDTDVAAAERLIAKWKGVTASELSTSQSFLIDLCELLGENRPHPTPELDYMFERPLTFEHADGSKSAGRVDLYKRGAFVLESKKLKAGAHTKGFDEAMLRAHSQAQNYARALPASEGRPPFLVVVDVGHRIELYSEFSRSGGSYVPFPDPRSHRIALDDLRKPEILDRLRRLWRAPLSLDPSREAARVTRQIAAQLAELAKSLERSGHAPEAVAQFLMRCLFTMFAEDVRLLPQDSFRDLLKTHAHTPDVAMRMVAQLWKDMDGGGFSAVLANDVLKFNGKLFKQPDTLPLDTAQIELLVKAASDKWEHVEPAIFGTLLERALSPGERHKLGAHYTPRAYVERLVLPTVIEPLRAEWSDAQAAALTLAAEGKPDEAVTELLKFHHRLCNVRVLDPACGSGNFLYVTLEHLKRLEGEVLNALDEIGYRQSGLALGGERADALGGETVDPHNLLGIELNPRAAAIAEVVLWIGYLQWHFRTRGDVNPPIPVIRDFRNIENRDAVLAHDGMEYVLDAAGVPVTRWDGETMKASPVTGEKIPDDAARKPIERYLNPRKAAWPQADFVVGNPPFIGNKRMRAALGDGYVEALRGAWPDVPESADFVMYWWHHAAQLTRRGALQRFGLITTNSIRQAFNRRVIEAALAPARTPLPSSPRRRGSLSTDGPVALPGSVIPAQAGIALGDGRKGQSDSRLRGNDDPKPEQALSLVFAIPDHPWVDVADGAAVRIGMTVSTRGSVAAVLREVVDEQEGQDEVAVTLREKRGTMFADLTIGANVVSAGRLRSNRGLANVGVQLSGMGFVVDGSTEAALRDSESAELLARYINGRDINQTSRGVTLVDTDGLSLDELRASYPSAFQHLLHNVKPERDQNKRASYREKWWLFAEQRRSLRDALVGLDQYLGTSRTSRHRFFVFVPGGTVPDAKVVGVALNGALHLGVLSSAIHEVWARAAGANLGVGNDLTYNHSDCFEPFPFPAAGEEQAAAIRTLAEHLDTHRKRQQAAHPDLTLTGMYNVLDKLRSGEPLTAKERVTHEHGLVSVLRQLHDDLDAAVLSAYGWSDLLPLLRIAHGNDAPGMDAQVPRAQDAQERPPAEGQTRDDAKRAFDDAILERLVALNAERAAEEARGHIRWLRPEFQNPQATAAPLQAELDTASGEDEDTPAAIAPVSTKPIPWPKDTVEQVRAVADLLAASPAPLSLHEIEARFTSRGAWKKRLPQLLEMLVALGRAELREGGVVGVGR